jgi:ATP-dependent DNA helicase RecG
MTEEQLLAELQVLLSLPSENEVVEFKKASTSFEIEELGEYFSALSNEANLKGKPYAWLVFGIEDKTHKIVGSNFKNKGTELNKLKKLIADKTTGNIGFIDIHVLNLAEGRVVMFQIPPAPQGIPIAYAGHCYAREHESLVPLNDEKRDRIRSQTSVDWSAVIIPDASIFDLDSEAIEKAKVEFLRRNPTKAEEMEEWSNQKFLDKAKLTKGGKITRTALLLLGKEESEHYLGSCDAKIRWILKDSKGETQGSEIICLPFLLAIDKVYQKIRNVKYRYAKEGTLFPEEVLRYDPFNIREPLNNCIAHRDYSISGRINVVEFESEKLVFSNVGTFIPGSVERVVEKDTPEERYRNTFLVEAMRNLNMVETEGGGIKKVFKNQSDRFFPLPEYDFADEKVAVTIQGKVLDMEFARILAQNKMLSLNEIFLLDKVQKGKALLLSEAKHLKELGLIDGRRPNYFLSMKAIAPINNALLKAEYIRNKSFHDEHFRGMILEFLKVNSPAPRRDIENLILGFLSKALTQKQQVDKVTNLLAFLRRKGKIRTKGSLGWELVKPK